MRIIIVSRSKMFSNPKSNFYDYGNFYEFLRDTRNSYVYKKITD